MSFIRYFSDLKPKPGKLFDTASMRTDILGNNIRLQIEATRRRSKRLR